ncbi:WD40 repeat-like protein [Coniochaeta hoffmannii]|uniref:WD40 repeat-like protein n=1 Tax=Coniochaeta hoffmannii TaxID=91930 RepID=A0AA38RGS3_9PEZI|nr:WD40 repeat-like protein [Coniochaeta hoffmannii]
MPTRKATQDHDNISDDSFGGFEDDGSTSGEEDAVQPGNQTAFADKDSDEEALERLVLGNKASFREHLFKDDFDSTFGALTAGTALDVAEKTTGSGLEDVQDHALFFIDTPAPTGDKQQSTASKVDEEPVDVPAWDDSDDERLTVSLASVSQLRKLRISEREDAVSGTEYARRLRQQYLRLYPHPTWALEAEGRLTNTKRRRRSSASSFTSSSGESEDDEEFDTSALPLDRFLRDANSFNGDGSRKRRKLRPETIDIQRTRDIPDTHKAAVGSLSFHPQFPILLSSSTSSILHLHHIMPTAHPTPNPSLTSVQVQHTPIRHSEFLSPKGDEIVFAGRRKYFHSWHLSSGTVRKVTRIQGHKLEKKTMERFRTSPDGLHMAVIATDRKGGGMLNIISMSTMQWVAQARLDARGGIADFSWWNNGEGITILGKDGQVAEWSLLSKRTVGTWRDAGSIGGTVLALGGQGGPTGLGTDRWVAVGSTSGVLNVYDRNNMVTAAADGGLEVKEVPEPQRGFEQLTTPITVVTFTPDGQLLAFGSVHKKDAFRLVHLPSCTVYRNWPTDNTPLGRITAVAFGQQSDLLAVGNDTGKIRLWEIRG